VRRVADGLGRLELGRELARRLAPGLVLALAAVRGLPAPFFGPFLTMSALPPFGRADDVPPLALAAPPLVLAALALAAPPLVLAALVLVAVPGLACDVRVRLVADLVDRDAPERAEVPRADRVVAERLVPPDDARAGAAAAGLAVDSDLAAEFSALAAAVIDLVAVFIACIAVDMVLADEVARVAAAVILVAAEVTLVAAEETVLAAVAGVVAEPDERVVVRRVVLAERVERPAVERVERVAVERPVLLRPVAERAVVELPAVRRAPLPAERAVEPRAGVFAVRDEVVVLGRPAERREALLLTDRALPELAGLRPAVARVVVCTGTDFPPS
jgi:hypothetical protein